MLLDAWTEQNKTTQGTQDMVEQFFAVGGDKHRLTLVNISYVENWFGPDKEVKSGKKKRILLVFAEQHCRDVDIDDDHKWNKDVEYETQKGKVEFKKGTHTKQP